MYKMTLQSIFKKGLFVVLFFLYLGSTKAQQHPMYSQYMFNMLNINPAFAGSAGVAQVTTLYRNQWIDMPGAPQNTSVTFDMPVDEKKIGFGVQLFDERLGIERSTGFNLIYAFKIPVSERGTLSMGLQAGILNYRANYTNVVTFQGNDPAFYQNINGILPSAAAGIFYNTDKFYIGFSTPALLKTKISNQGVADVSSATGTDLHLFLSSGYNFDLSENVVLKPSFLVKAVSGAPLEYDLNLNVWMQNIFGVGISYRTGDAIVGIAQLKLGERLNFGYAYDKTFTNLGSYSRGSHELMLRLEIGRHTENVSSIRYN